MEFATYQAFPLWQMQLNETKSLLQMHVNAVKLRSDNEDTLELQMSVVKLTALKSFISSEMYLHTFW